jgi:DNA-directed RNA polymerase specialized sigma24 family protein
MLDAETGTMKEPAADQDPLERLLNWLDEDREQAWTQYEEIRRRLCQFFARRECLDAEGLADLTLKRVARRFSEIKTSFAQFSFGVARNVHLEYLRSPERKRETEDKANALPAAPLDEEDPRLACFEKCLKESPADDRDLLLRWHKPADRQRGEKQAALRDRIYDELGEPEGSVRARVTRLKMKLRKCVENCLSVSGAQQNR